MNTTDTGALRGEAETARSGWFKRLIDLAAKGFSLRQRIIFILAVTALPGVAVAIALAANKLSEQTLQIETSVKRLALLGAAQHEAVLEQARIFLASNAAKLPASGLETGCGLLDKVPEGFPAVTDPVLFNASGARICANDETESLFDPGGREWLARALEEENFVLGEYSIAGTGKPLVVAAYPVMSEEGGEAGVLALGIDLRWLDFIASTIDLPQSTTISALSSNGHLLSHNSAEPSDSGTDEAAPPSSETRKAIAGMPAGTLRSMDASGSPRVYGFARTSRGGLSIVVGSPRYYEFVQYGDALLHTLLAPIAILAVALFAAGWAAEVFVTRHVRKMTRAAEEIASGNLSQRTEVPYEEHEIGELAGAFDEMAESIETEHTGLRKDVRRRDVLIGELNHRVKNYLQMMLSMVEQNRRDVTPDNVAERFNSLAGRICTLGEIHRLLHQDSVERAPELGPYTHKLVKLLAEFHDLTVKPVQISAAAGKASLDISNSVSYGLILNELIANARKHAFPDGREGRVSVALAQEKSNEDGKAHVRLTVTDNGVGIPRDLETTNGGSTGLRMVHALAHQLNGEVRTKRLKQGSAFEVLFPAAD